MTAAEIQQRLVPDSYTFQVCGTLLIVNRGRNGWWVKAERWADVGHGFIKNQSGHQEEFKSTFPTLESACAAIALWMERQEKPADLGVDPDTLG